MRHFLPVLALAVTASAFGYSNAEQQVPIGYSADPQSLAYPAPHLFFIRCPVETHWECSFHTHVYCGCVENKQHEVAENYSVQTKSIKTFEVIAELQPGNNQTLLNLYNIECGLNERVGCHLTLGKFACGCLPDYDHAHGEKGDKKSNECEGKQMKEEEKAFEHKKEQQGGEENGEGPLVADSARDFPFSNVKWPRCTKIGWHIKCCPEEGKIVCFCGTGTAGC